MANDEDFPTVPKRTHLDELLEMAESQQDILLAWAERGGNGNQAAVAMVRLSQCQKGGSELNQSELLKDPRLQDMMDTVAAQVGGAVLVVCNHCQLGLKETKTLSSKFM